MAWTFLNFLPLCENANFTRKKINVFSSSFLVANSPTLTLHNFSFRQDPLNAPKGQEIVHAIDEAVEIFPPKFESMEKMVATDIATDSITLSHGGASASEPNNEESMEIDDDEPLEEEEEDRLDVTSTGRKRRYAASTGRKRRYAAKRASERLSATMDYINKHQKHMKNCKKNSTNKNCSKNCIFCYQPGGESDEEADEDIPLAAKKKGAKVAKM